MFDEDEDDGVLGNESGGDPEEASFDWSQVRADQREKAPSS